MGSPGSARTSAGRQREQESRGARPVVERAMARKRKPRVVMTRRSHTMLDAFDPPSLGQIAALHRFDDSLLERRTDLRRRPEVLFEYDETFGGCGFNG